MHLETVTKYVAEEHPVDVIYLDLQKAFDKVPHKRLLQKLQAHGIEGQVLRWIQAWLADRKQRVVVQGAKSKTSDVSSSVVQGSVLGPLCFLIFMNDLEINIISEISKFADDTKMTSKVGSDEEIQKLQEDLDKLMDWSDKWKMSFNVDKCSVMHIGHNNPQHQYQMKNKALASTTEEKDLGVWTENTLKVGKQAAEATKKANRTLGMVKRAFKYRSKRIILQLYKSLIRPHLDYSIQAWRPYQQKDIKLLEGVQRRTTKIIPELKSKPYHERLKELNLMTLEDRMRRADLIQTYRIFTGIDNIKPTDMFQLAEYQATRGHPMKLQKQHMRVDTRRYFFSQRVISDWNRLPNSTVLAPTINDFKTKLQTFLGY